MLQLSLFNGFQILQLRLVSFQIVVHNAIQVWNWWLIPFLIMWYFQPSKRKLPTAFSCKSKRKYLSLFNRKARLYQCKYRVSHWPWLMAHESTSNLEGSSAQFKQVIKKFQSLSNNSTMRKAVTPNRNRDTWSMSYQLVADRSSIQSALRSMQSWSEMDCWNYTYNITWI